MAFVLHYFFFFSNDISKQFLDDRLCFLPELKSGIFTIRYTKDNVSFWGRGQIGLLMVHYKRCCVGLGPLCMTPVGIERQENCHGHEDCAASCQE